MVKELLWPPLKAEKRRIAAILFALAVLAVANAVFLMMVRGFVKALFAEGSADIALGDLIPSLPGLQGRMVPRATLVYAVPAVIAGAGVIKGFATYLYQLHQQALALTMAREYREKLFDALLTMPYVAIRRRSAGAWMSLIMNDVAFLQSRFSDLMTGLVKDGVLIVSCFCVLAYVHWQTALVMAMLAPVIAVGMGRTGRRIARFAEQFQREMAKLAAAVLDIRARFDFIRAQGGEALERERFAKLNNAYYRMIRQSIMVRSAFAPVLELLGFVVFALAVWAIGKGQWGTSFTPETLLQFFVALGLLLKPLREIGEQLSRLEETKGALAATFDVFRAAKDQRPAFPASPGDKQFSVYINGIAAGHDGKVRFEAQDLALPAGRAIAVIGPSGAGKSTLIRTLAGLIEPSSWTADRPWTEVSGMSSMVSQEPFLFDASIADNLRYGLAASVPDKTLWQALALVNMDHEARQLPDGLATRVRAIGSNVSGGQLQRLVIARGLMRDRPLWLLDEATSAIDPTTERDITERLIAACRERGTILVAATHRLEFLDLYDEVWFVEGGGVALRGKHATLQATPRYRDYCATGGTP